MSYREEKKNKFSFIVQNKQENQKKQQNISLII